MGRRRIKENLKKLQKRFWSKRMGVKKLGMGTWENSVALENQREYRDDLSSCWRRAQGAQVGTGLDLDHCDVETRETGGKEADEFPKNGSFCMEEEKFLGMD